MKNAYSLLKSNHFDLPKLKQRTITPQKTKCKTDSRIAHSHSSKKEICFSLRFLKRRAYVNRVWNLGNWQVLEGTLALVELLTHEISHWRCKGSHNKRFYAKQKRYLDTLINLVISDEFYTARQNQITGETNE